MTREERIQMLSKALSGISTQELDLIFSVVRNAYFSKKEELTSEEISSALEENHGYFKKY